MDSYVTTTSVRRGGKEGGWERGREGRREWRRGERVCLCHCVKWSEEGREGERGTCSGAGLRGQLCHHNWSVVERKGRWVGAKEGGWMGIKERWREGER